MKNTNISKFYTFGSKLISSTVQAHPVNLNNSGDDRKLILGETNSITFPVIFQQKYGKKYQDILDTGYQSLYLISSKIKDIFEANELTGWSTFDVILLDKEGTKVDGYFGLSIIGKCGRVNFEKGEVIEKRLVSSGPLSKYYRGLHIGLNEWDGSDFFIPSDYHQIIVSEKVANITKKAKLTNVNLTNLAEIELPEIVIEKHRKKAN